MGRAARGKQGRRQTGRDYGTFYQMSVDMLKLAEHATQLLDMAIESLTTKEPIEPGALQSMRDAAAQTHTLIAQQRGLLDAFTDSVSRLQR